MSARRNSSKIKFGTDGWRGIIGDDFTFPNVRKVTRAIASYLETAYTKDRLVLVAYDTRFLADQFARTATPEITDTIVANIEGTDDKPPSSSWTGQISTFDPKPEYLQFLYTLLDCASFL